MTRAEPVLAGSACLRVPQTFLHIDPDTGMTVVMIADEYGFRPMTATEEAQDILLSSFGLDVARAAAAVEADSEESLDAAIDDFVRRHEHAFMAA